MTDIKVKVKEMKPAKVAYVEHKGPYDKMPFDESMGKIMGWMKEKGVKPNFRLIMGIYHDDPHKVAAEELRSEMAIGMKGNAEGGEEVKVKELPAMQTAVARFKGPTDQLKGTYDALGCWVAENGYEGAGPIMEVYTGKPKKKDGKTILKANIHVPIKKK